MSRTPRIPSSLPDSPFTRAEALAAGVTSRMLQGRAYARVHPGVWRLACHQLSDDDRIVAARKALPPQARISHLTRLHVLGLDLGSREPVHFTVVGDLHLALDGIFLHRTVVMPPLDDVGVRPAVAFVQVASTARVIDLVKIGDWLLAQGHMTTLEVAEIVRFQRWRPGSAAAAAVLPLLDGRSASFRESEVRMLIRFAGLPSPGVNVGLVDDGGRVVACADLLYERWRLIVEYEGRQHLGDPWQWGRDIGRYADLRAHGWEYVQVTAEMLRQPRAVVGLVHSRLVDRGYTGPGPSFGAVWRELFRPPARGLCSRIGAPATESRRHSVPLAPPTPGFGS